MRSLVVLIAAMVLCCLVNPVVSVDGRVSVAKAIPVDSGVQTELPQPRTVVCKYPGDQKYKECLEYAVGTLGGTIKPVDAKPPAMSANTFRFLAATRVFDMVTMQESVCATRYQSRAMLNDAENKTQLMKTYKAAYDNSVLRQDQAGQEANLRQMNILKEKIEHLQEERKLLADKALRIEEELKRMAAHHAHMSGAEAEYSKKLAAKIEHEENVRKLIQFNNDVHFNDKVFRMRINGLVKKKFARFLRFFIPTYLKDQKNRPRAGWSGDLNEKTESSDPLAPVENAHKYNIEPGHDFSNGATPGGINDQGDDVSPQGQGKGMSEFDLSMGNMN